MIQRALEAYYRWQFERRRKYVEKLLMDKKSGFAQVVENRSLELAMTMVMRWLDNQRLRHCAVCPGTLTLRRAGDKWWCPEHYVEAEKAYANYQKQRKEATQTVAA